MSEVSASSADPRTCAICGGLIPPASPGGQCPRCLLRLASFSDLEEIEADEQFLHARQLRDFGDYELLDEIARGGMGVVYRAWQHSAEREVAVKMILAGQLATPAAVARFENEAAAAQRLDHPHIVPVFEIGEYETQHFLSMRFVPGGRNIATWAAELPPDLRFRAIALTMAEVARAIAFAHERGVLHRDLKPSNILIDENDEPQITDFGLAKLLDGTSPDLTISSVILGSPSYMAPEQADSRGREITTATDVYGLGAVLYELLAGRPPFTGPSPLLIARRVVEDFPPRIPDVPEDLETLCLKCLLKEPTQRYGSALAVAEELERFARGQPIVAEPQGTLSMIIRWARLKPIAASLAVALLLALLGGFIAVLWQWQYAEQARRETIAVNAQLRGTNIRLSQTVSHLQWRSLDVLLERDYAPRALAELAKRLRADPGNWQAATFALSILEQRPFAFPAGPAIPVPEEWTALPPALNAEAGRLALAARDGRVRIVELATGAETCPVFVVPDLTACALSPDGSRLAVGQKGGEVALYELPAGRLLGRSATAAAPLRVLTFSADGLQLAFAGGELVGTAPLADIAASQPPLRLLAAGFAPAQLRCSADGATLAAWGAARTGHLVVWGPPGSGEPLRPSDGKPARRAALDAAGTRLAFSTNAYEVQIWDLASRELISRCKDFGTQADTISLTPDGRRLAVGGISGVTRIFSTATGFPASAPMTQRYGSSDLAFDRSGTHLLTGDQDFTARLWDVHTGQPRSEAILHEGEVDKVALNSTGRQAATLARLPGQREFIAHLWQLHPPDRPRTFTPEGGRDFDGSADSPDERFIAVGSFIPANTVSFYDLASGRLLVDRLPLKGPVYGCEFTPDGRRLIITTNNGWLYGWAVPAPGADPTVWTPLWEPVQSGRGLQPSTLSPDGSLMALGGTDGIVRLHATDTGAPVRSFTHGALIKGLRFSADGTRLVAGAVDGVGAVWEVATGTRLATLRGHTAEIISSCFSPDGTRVATASYDTTARLWDAATGLPIARPLRHFAELSVVKFSPDGRIVATASRDGTARLWDSANGEPLFEPLAHGTTVQYLDFHPDGRRLLTVDLAGFRLWDVATAEPITLHYPLISSAGLGFDCPSGHDLITPRGGHFRLSNALEAAVFWPLLDPPAPVPAWFPEFLDDLARGGFNAADAPSQPPPTDRLLLWREKARTLSDQDYYGAWLRRYLRLQPAS